MKKSALLHAAKADGSAAGEAESGDRNAIQRRTVTRVDLAEAVYRRIGLSRRESAALVQSVLDEIADALTAGESVKLSSFGRFLVRAKSQRIGRNPKTGVEAPITPRRVMVFKPSNVLKAKLNGVAVASEEEE
jgi:integration host factor subunit alpha